MDRSLVRFYAGIKSEVTRKTYESDLKRFLKFVKIKDAGGLLQLKDSYLQELVEDYTIFLKSKGLRYNSVNCAVSALETFFFMNDKSLNFKKIRKMMPEKLKLMGGSAWTTEDIKRMLESTTSLRNKAIIHLLASSGCRKGAVIGLKLRNVSEMTDGCKAVLFYEGSKEEQIEELNEKSKEKNLLKKIIRLLVGRKNIRKPSLGRLTGGILSGIVIYSSLIYGTTLYESTNISEIFTKIIALVDGAVLYVVMITFIGMVALNPFLTKRDASFFAGITISFAVFEVWFALRCPETIPFMANLVSHSCKL